MKALRFITLLILLFLSSACQQQQTRADVNTPQHEPNKTAEVNLKLGIEHIREGNNMVALKKLQRAIEIDPTYPEAHSVLGLLYRSLGEYKLAEIHLEKAVDLRPDLSSALNNYGLFLCSQGRAEEGAAMFLRAIENPLNPTPEVAFTNAGLCAYSNGDMLTAETQFRNALQRNPTVVTALLHMSSIAYENKNYLSARGYLQRYLAVAKHTAQSLWLGIRIERELGDRDALSSYELLLRANFPDSREVMLLNE